MAKNEARLELTAVDNATRVIKSVQSSVSGLASSWKLLGAAVVTGFAGSFLTDAIKMRSALDDLADTTGDNVKTLDGFRRVLQVAGVELESGGQALAKFAKNLNAADDDGKAASEAIGAIGLDLKALQALKPAEAMLEVAKALGKFEDGASKVGVAMALFGKEGARLLPVLKDLAEEGSYAGKITAEQAAQAELLEKSWRRLGIAFDDGKQALASGIIPSLTKLVDEMREGIRIAGSFGQALLIFGTQNPFKTAAEQANAAREAIDNLVKGRENLARLPGYDAALKQIDEQIAVERKRLEFSNFRAREEALAGRTGPQFLDARDLRAQQKPVLDFKGAAAREKTASDPGKELINQLESEIAKTQGLTREEEILLLLQTERYAKVTAAQRERLVALAKESDEAKVQVELGKLQLELDKQETQNRIKAAEAQSNYERSVREANAAAAEQIAQRVDPTRALYQEIKKIADLVNAGALDPETGEARLQAINREIDAMNRYGTEIDKNAELAHSLSLVLSSGFSKAITEGGKLRDVLRGIGQDILQIVTKKIVLDPIQKELDGVLKGGLGGLFKGFGGGGGGGGGFGFLDELFVGSFATGTRFVPRTGLALLHEGEAVIPAEQNARGMAGNNIYIDARGADAGVEQRLLQVMRQYAGPGVVERRAVAAVSDARRR